MAPAHSLCGRLYINFIDGSITAKLWLMIPRTFKHCCKYTCMVSVLTVLRHCGGEEFNLMKCQSTAIYSAAEQKSLFFLTLHAPTMNAFSCNVSVQSIKETPLSITEAMTNGDVDLAKRVRLNAIDKILTVENCSGMFTSTQYCHMQLT